MSNGVAATANSRVPVPRDRENDYTLHAANERQADLGNRAGEAGHVPKGMELRLARILKTRSALERVDGDAQQLPHIGESGMMRGLEFFVEQQH